MPQGQPEAKLTKFSRANQLDTSQEVRSVFPEIFCIVSQGEPAPQTPGESMIPFLESMHAAPKEDNIM